MRQLPHRNEEVTTLRETVDGDLPHFFEHQRDDAANDMAAFAAKDPHDADAFARRWRHIRSDATIVHRTIVDGSEVVGHIASFDEEGRREITYWIAPERWRRGYASEALRQFVALDATRPLYARAASDNLASLRVLEKHGFVRLSESLSYAAARNSVIAETLLMLH